MQSKRVKICAISLSLLCALLISRNVDAGRHSTDALETIHLAELDWLSRKDQTTDKGVKQVYEEILAIYPDDAWAQDKLALMTSSDFYDIDPPATEPSTSNSDRRLFEEAAKYLKEAYIASCDETASENFFGFMLEGKLITGSDIADKADEIASIRGAVEYELTSLEKVSEIRFSASNHSAGCFDGNLMITALVLNRDGQPVLGREFWLVAGERSANDAVVTRDLDRADDTWSPHATFANGYTLGLDTESRANIRLEMPKTHMVFSAGGKEMPCH